MKNIYILIITLLLSSCARQKYTYIDQEIIDGKVSAVKKVHVGKFASCPVIWVQNATNTQKVDIPFGYEGKWKVGNNCLLIIEKYKENENK